MSQPKQTPDPPTVTARHAEHYRDSYANSVQVRMSVWDFFLVFGTMHQESPEEVKIENFQGIYLSPQQAKALMNVLGHNLAQYEQTFGTLAQYEQTFGTLALEPQFGPPGGPVH
jgi:flagellar protein FlaG